MNKKFYIPVVLMAVTIAIITVFQGYWLYKNYKEEQRILRIKSNFLFREAVYKLQASKLNLDTNINFRYQNRGAIISITNAIRQRFKDSMKHVPKDGPTMVMQTTPGKLTGTDTNIKMFLGGRSGDRVFDFLTSVDSLQKPISVNEITERYQTALLKDKITVPFTILILDTVTRREFSSPPDPDNNNVTIGFANPVTYQLNFSNTGPYILKKLSIPIVVSVLLISITLLSFLLLYKNLLQQRRLAAVKNEFISNITHELKTPIATVSVAIEALKNFNALQDPQRTKEYLDISGQELQRLSLLVDKVLRLSMFEKHQVTVNKEPVDIKQLVEEVAATLRLQFEKHEAQFSVHAEGQQFIVMADRMHITSVIYNLLDNALKYSGNNPTIEVLLKEMNDGVELAVVDNGIGIAEEYTQKIFDKFFRVPQGNTHNVKGYGLGLSYVAYIVQLHKGIIAVKSQPGVGSRFTIKLPL
jgi:two-component system, OmpR family, phosphate regulon sensor histidine kinase PhoR